MKIKCSKCGEWKLRNDDSIKRALKKHGKDFGKWLKSYTCMKCRGDRGVLKSVKATLTPEEQKLIKA